MSSPDSDLPTIQLDRVVDSTAWSQKFRKSNFNFTKHVANRHLGMDHSFNLQRARALSGDLQMLILMRPPAGAVRFLDRQKVFTGKRESKRCSGSGRQKPTAKEDDKTLAILSSSFVPRNQLLQLKSDGAAAWHRLFQSQF